MKKSLRISNLAVLMIQTTIGLGLIGWLVLKVDFSEVRTAFGTVDWRCLSLMVPVMMIALLLRSWRWRQILPNRAAPLEQIFAAISVSYLANNVLPARGGDLIRVVLLGQRTDMSQATLLSTVVVERAIDLIAASLMLAVSIAMLQGSVPRWMFYGGALFGVGGLIGLVLLVLLRSYALIWGTALLECMPLSTHRATRLRSMLMRFVVGFQRLGNFWVMVSFFLATVIVWLLEGTVVFTCGQAFGLSLTVFESWIVLLFVVFGSLIPGPPGQVGVFEFSVVSSLAFLGRDANQSLAFGAGLHIVLMTVTSVVGLASLVAYPKRWTYLKSLRNEP